jgi:hypothetical protein
MKSNLLILIFGLSSLFCLSQVGIGTTTPDPSAILDITSTDKGVLVPRVSLNDVTDISVATGTIPNPTDGLLVWNTNASTIGGTGIGFYYFLGTRWLPITKQNNTLDQAYDETGAGAGRIITADAGAVKIAGTDGFFVTGTFGSGTTIEESGAGTRMFFNPRKAAFRAGFVNGAQWNDINVGNYSFAANRNNIASGAMSFAANDGNIASGNNSASFGRDNISSGLTSFSTGAGNTASGENSFVGGNGSVASGLNSFSFGQSNEANSFAEVVLGNYATIGTLSNGDSNTQFYTTDRAFAIGDGTSTTTRSNALEVFKDGRITINEAYTLPNVDGNTGQTLVTDGTGNVSWEDANNSAIVSLTLFATDTDYNLISPTTTVIPGNEAGIIPTIYDTNGNLQVKLVIRYTSNSGTTEFRLRVRDGSTTSFPISYTDSKTFNTTSTGGVAESDWQNWNAGNSNPYELALQATTTGNFTIENVYLLVRAQ